MSIKHIKANKRRWAAKSKKEKAEIMANVANKRWKKATSEEKKKQGKLMNIARWPKAKIEKSVNN